MEDMEVYRQAAMAREAARRWALALRRERAWDIARRAAYILKEDFGAQRVLVFGSLAHGAWFHDHSDIDLAVEGIAPELFWKAWCALDQLGSDIEINLVPTESAKDALRHEIREKGLEI